MCNSVISSIATDMDNHQSQVAHYDFMIKITPSQRGEVISQ